MMMKVLEHNVKTGKAKTKELMTAYENFQRYEEQQEKESQERTDAILKEVQ